MSGSATGRVPTAPAASAGSPQPATAGTASAGPALKKHARVVDTVAVPPDFTPRRLPAALRQLLPGRYASDTAAKKAARRGEAYVNGGKGTTETEVAPGAIIEIVQRCGAEAVAAAGRPGLVVVYEDDDMACVVKPQGLPTQGKGDGSLQGRIKWLPRHPAGPRLGPRTPQIHALDPITFPSAHRLDAPTGGLVLVGKTRRALAALGEDLRAHRMQKRYVALVTGRVEGEGLIDFPLDGRAAVTLYRAAAASRVTPPAAGGGGDGEAAAGGGGGWVTRVHLWPKTGRTHQLRKHMAYLGHPLLGERQYQHRRKEGIAFTPCDMEPLLGGMAAGDDVNGGGGGGGGGAGPAAGSVEATAASEGPTDSGGAGPAGKKRARHEAGGGGGRGADDCGGSCWPAGEGSRVVAQQPGGGVKVAADGLLESLYTKGGPGAEAEADADASDGEDGGGGGGGGDGGGGQPLCLWAVELQLSHPVTRRPLRFGIPEPPEYDALCPAPPTAAPTGEEGAGCGAG
ncbi:Ribosomal large subunit pseudouridine synthase D [Monoraphidium neglectum]|uniref:Ribosomal large subunit pseudouridine synthase D n=1 Tax=Monoraphidium neglectum TaxID=145388 RepID=A0A0D2MPX1_9CHLO|nr:Ribosomal large subunit pseudouridine synthase D [Monoraphidium neglectum]KIY96680.1 Ribosomal large subunit pseudouridine synthase D [Monoraphidium neglectum]|eukprot:XP_013895700.1 Ribosomal large subunit pseudouridine synthase D [Monoraphidium neglectum]